MALRRGKAPFPMSFGEGSEPSSLKLDKNMGGISKKWQGKRRNGAR